LCPPAAVLRIKSTCRERRKEKKRKYQISVYHGVQNAQATNKKKPPFLLSFYVRRYPTYPLSKPDHATTYEATLGQGIPAIIVRMFTFDLVSFPQYPTYPACQGWLQHRHPARSDSRQRDDTEEICRRIWTCIQHRAGPFADAEGLAALLDYLGDNPWVQVFAVICDGFGKDNPRRPVRLWRDVDEELLDLVAGLTNFDPARRLITHEALGHRWFDGV